MHCLYFGLLLAIHVSSLRVDDDADEDVSEAHVGRHGCGGRGNISPRRHPLHRPGGCGLITDPDLAGGLTFGGGSHVAAVRRQREDGPDRTTAAPVEASHDEDPAGGVVNGVQKAGEAIVSVGSATRQAGENAATRLAEAGESAREAGEAAVWAVGDAARSHITKNIEARGENKAAARTIREIVAKAMDQRKDTGSEDASAVSKPHHAGCHEAVKLRLDTSPQQTGEDAAAAARGAGQNQAEVAKAAGVAAGEMAVAEGLLPDQAAGIAWDSARKAGGTKREAIIAAAEVAGHAAAAKGETPAMVAKVTAKAVKAAGGCQADVANAAGIAADKVAKARGVAPRVAERIADEAAAAATASAKPNVQVQQHRHSDGGRYRARFRAPPHAKDGGTKAFVRAVGRAAARAAASEELSVAKAARVIANAVYAAGGDGDDVAVTVGASIGSAGARARITPLHAAQAARKLFEMEGGTHISSEVEATCWLLSRLFSCTRSLRGRSQRCVRVVSTEGGHTLCRRSRRFPDGRGECCRSCGGAGCRLTGGRTAQAPCCSTCCACWTHGAAEPSHVACFTSEDVAHGPGQTRWYRRPCTCGGKCTA
eukprot:TRINITY_DN13576_c1_g1_i7.p1 TRINITY_DN13576_c1_g1~~TRINITY_DN13576_c1_g1_i7.p1  ORF type:complete len:596 (-),score=130.56 TRINITY_DN13576_c1_g1_i7:452-2239(-)